MAKDPYKYFRVEAKELLDALTQGTLDLERGSADRELLARLLRVAHTLKGASRVVRQTGMADAAHAIEDVLAPYREGGTAVERAHTAEMFRLLDLASAALAALEAPAPSAPAAEARPAEPPAPASSPAWPRVDEGRPVAPPAEAVEPARLAIAETVRIEITEMDSVLDGIAESGVRMGAVRQASMELDDARGAARALVEELSQPHWRTSGNGLERARTRAEELVTRLEQGFGQLVGGVEAVERELEQLQDRAARLRLVAADTLFAPLARAARDAAQTLGRRIAFDTSGGDARLDAHVVAALRDALLHVVRNAVAHGIEPEAERLAAGKEPQGHLRLTVERRGDRVAFACQDDGRGIDVDAVRTVALRKGLLTPAEAAALDMEKATRLIFRAGISTRGAVDAVSGRGVGLDVVQEVVNRFKGEAHATSTPGRGTTVEICVPISLSSLPALSMEVGAFKLWIPLDAVARTVRIAPADLVRSAKGTSLVQGEEVVPFLPLSDVLPRDGTARRATQAWSAAVVRAGNRLAAVGVERFLGVRQVVVRPLPRLLAALPVVAGAVLDAEGHPQLVLDARRLVETACAGVAPVAEAEAGKRPPILVVDDSLTTRMLEQSILESAGYEVDLAVSAEDALAKAAERRYGLFLVDVEMPGMNGFQFVARTKQDPQLRETPSILVTSLGSVEDRRRGMEAGAHAHIVKGEFDEARLRQLIHDLIG